MYGALLFLNILDNFFKYLSYICLLLVYITFNIWVVNLQEFQIFGFRYSVHFLKQIRVSLVCIDETALFSKSIECEVNYSICWNNGGVTLKPLVPDWSPTFGRRSSFQVSDLETACYVKDLRPLYQTRKSYINNIVLELLIM